MDKETAIQEASKIFGLYDKKIYGFSITAKKVKSGILCMLWYARNTWVDDSLERKILFSKGRIFEDNKQIASYKTQQNG